MFDVTKVRKILEEKNYHLIKCGVVRNRYWITDKKNFLEINFKLTVDIFKLKRNNNDVVNYLIDSFKKEYETIENSDGKIVKKIPFEKFYNENRIS